MPVIRHHRHALLAASLIVWAIGQAPAGASLKDSLPTPAPPPLPGLDATLKPVGGAFLYYEDFERGLDKWTVSGGEGDWGWHLLNAKTCGGLFTMHLGHKKHQSLTPKATDGFVTFKTPIDLRKAKNPVLKFDVKGSAVPYDAATYQTQVRQPGGAWKTLGPAIDARFPMVRSIYLDLRPYKGSKLELRFHGKLKPSAKPTLGLYLDDIHVIEATRL